jgi:hypothetical protein
MVKFAQRTQMNVTRALALPTLEYEKDEKRRNLGDVRRQRVGDRFLQIVKDQTAFLDAVDN